jgi:hypothetical protein
VRWFELNVTDAGALTFEGDWTSKDDLIMALTISYGTEGEPTAYQAGTVILVFCCSIEKKSWNQNDNT